MWLILLDNTNNQEDFMGEINDSAIPKGAGIVTFEMIYRAAQKLGARVDRLEKYIDELEIKKNIPLPKEKINAVGKEINITEKKVK